LAKNRTPEILFYFAVKKIAQDEIDTNQLSLVNDFRKEIGKLGVKYETYDDLMEFKVALHRHLSDAVYEVLGKDTGKQIDYQPQFEYREFLPNYERLVLENPSIAADDLFEKATNLLDAHTQEMESLTKDLGRMTFNLDKQTKRLTHERSKRNDEQVFTAAQNILSILNDYRNKLKTRLPKMRSSMEESLVLTQRAINLVRSNQLHNEFVLRDLMNPLSEMKSALEALKPKVEALNVSIEDWPNSSKEINNNKYRMLALHKDFCEYVNKSVALITVIE